jgi:uncharacterized protein (TIGR03435 family)
LKNKLSTFAFGGDNSLMPDANDMDLVREFARDNSEAAFTELVRRHINLVYSVARRCTGNDGDAHDVTQAVFIILARKAAGLREKTLLTGWLYETTRFAAARLLRTNARRYAREQEAYMQSTLNEADNSAVWEKLSPHLEAAMSKLAERDRALLVLRFYENKSGSEAAALLGIREDTAHKRVARAIEKLRKVFAQRGVTLSGAAIAGAVSANSVQAAPVALVKTISIVAVVKGSVATASTLTLVKGTLNLMAWAKAKTATLISTSLLVACGAAVYVWEVPTASFDVLHTTSPQVKIVPTKYPDSPGTGVGIDDQTLGISMPMETLIKRAYAVDDLRIILVTKLPDGKYDYIANLPSGSAKALQQEIKKQFGIVGHFEPRLKDVFVLKVKDASALKLTPRPNKFPYAKAGEWPEGNQFHWGGQPTSGLADWLEGYFQIPVVDQIGRTNASGFDFVLDWDVKSRDSEKLKQALNQIGLELIPTNMPIEILVVEKVK